MTDLVARAKAALEGVTEGPWVAWHQRPGARNEAGIYPGNIVSDTTKQIVVTQSGNVANSKFISAARSLVPELVAELEQLRAHVAAMPSAIRAYAADELTSVSYAMGEPLATPEDKLYLIGERETLLRLQRHAEDIVSYAATADGA